MPIERPMASYVVVIRKMKRSGGRVARRSAMLLGDRPPVTRRGSPGAARCSPRRACAARRRRGSPSRGGSPRRWRGRPPGAELLDRLHLLLVDLAAGGGDEVVRLLAGAGGELLPHRLHL